jgi:hypothetical protein
MIDEWRLLIVEGKTLIRDSIDETAAFSRGVADMPLLRKSTIAIHQSSIMVQRPV